ncbi:hypothetical protein F5B20DRAFT_583495 [Whalleya microplaca]|nr:hypothetical protein F5B20DRAFT_583495 [Whalleya microplaca]
MQALTTIFSPPAWCANRYAVFIDTRTSESSTITPSSGWVDPSFTQCVPTQYATQYPTFSPGVCPEHMSLATSTAKVHHGRTVWTGGCCQSGFSTMEIEPRYLCTSTLTAPMAFLLDPNISTTDIYTTLSSSGLWIEHDQLTVQWEETDLEILPREIATHYASIMGVAYPSPAETATVTSTSSTSVGDAGTPSTAVPPSATPAASTVITPSATGTTTSVLSGDTPSSTLSSSVPSLSIPSSWTSSSLTPSPTSSSAGERLHYTIKASVVACIAFLSLIV